MNMKRERESEFKRWQNAAAAARRWWLRLRRWRGGGLELERITEYGLRTERAVDSAISADDNKDEKAERDEKVNKVKILRHYTNRQTQFDNQIK